MSDSLASAVVGGVENEPVSARLMVLEMTVAAIAARLPQKDLEEVVSMLVFVARSSEAAESVADAPFLPGELGAAGRLATAMLDRISKSRRSDRAAPGN